jgi:subtilisin family serine protease
MTEYIVLRNLAISQGKALLSTADIQSALMPSAFTESPPLPKVEIHDLTNDQVSDLIRDPEVVGAGPVMQTALVTPVSASTKPDGTVWGISAVGADISSRNGDGVVPAVVDTGIDRTHPAFDGLDLSQQDFTGLGDGDQHGHGTFCAGTIFGRDVEGKRIGIARGVRHALIARVLDSAGKGTSAMFFKGLEWAISQGANVISMSLGFEFSGTVEYFMQAKGLPIRAATSSALDAYRAHLRMFDALMQMCQAQAAFGGGSVICAASGNESDRPQYVVSASLPSAAQGVISVGALGRDGDKFTIAPFSNAFAQITAPGVNIISAKLGGGLTTMSGTSMACPHVAGVACLWWEDVKKTGSASATAPSINNKLLSGGRIDHLAPGILPTDRGSGIVTAPT